MTIHPAIAKLLAPHASGVFDRIAAPIYHGGEGVSQSHLKLLAESPFELWHSLTSEEPESSSSPQILGSVLDHFIERDALDTLPANFVCVPDIHMGSKEGRALKLANAGRVLVKTPMVDTANKCFAAIMKHPRIVKLLRDSRRQLSVFSDYEVTGADGKVTKLTRRCRPDIVPPESYLADGYSFLMDLKTTSADLSEQNNWWWECKRWGYFLQAGWYLNVCRAAGLDRTLFCHLAVETHEPYRVRCFSLDAVEVETAYQAALKLLARLVECALTDRWEDDADRIVPLLSPYIKT